MCSEFLWFQNVSGIVPPDQIRSTPCRTFTGMMKIILVWMNNELKFHNQAAKSVLKANHMLGLIKHGFTNLDELTLFRLAWWTIPTDHIIRHPYFK